VLRATACSAFVSALGKESVRKSQDLRTQLSNQ